MATTPWPSDWMRGALTLAVMRVMHDGPTYGYAIAEALETNGFGAIKGGTLYPLLSRLEANGLVVTQWREGDGGPGRKYFTLSADGERQFAEQQAQWRAFATHTMTFICDEEQQ